MKEASPETKGQDTEKKPSYYTDLTDVTADSEPQPFKMYGFQFNPAKTIKGYSIESSQETVYSPVISYIKIGANGHNTNFTAFEETLLKQLKTAKADMDEFGKETTATSLKLGFSNLSISFKDLAKITVDALNKSELLSLADKIKAEEGIKQIQDDEIQKGGRC